MIVLTITAVMLTVGGIAVVSSNGGSAAVASGNKLCPPNPTPTPTVPPGSPTPTQGPATYPENCVVPWLPGWRPKLGAVFNNPIGKASEAQAIIRRVIKAINHSRKGSTIRIAVYSFDRGDVAHALRKAKKRGVHIQIAVNARVMSGTARSLQRQLGKNPRKRDFVVACSGACRTKGSGGNLHSKVYTFSHTGGARGLIIISSGNLTSKAVYRQWNDSFAVANDTGLWSAWIDMFKQVSRQKKVGPRRINYTTTTGMFRVSFSKAAAREVTTTNTTTTPISNARYSKAHDPVVSRLKKVSCVAPAGYGKNGRTVLRISMYAMFKARGEALAAQLVRLKKKGCNIKMIMSVPGGKTSRMLSKAGIPLRSADWLFNERDPLVEDGIGGYGPSFYSHYKVMAMSGVYDGVPTKTVWTGSENWGAISFANEEVVLRINQAATYGAYLAQFNKMWSGRATHRMGIEPNYGP